MPREEEGGKGAAAFPNTIIIAHCGGKCFIFSRGYGIILEKISEKGARDAGKDGRCGHERGRGQLRRRAALERTGFSRGGAVHAQLGGAGRARRVHGGGGFCRCRARMRAAGHSLLHRRFFARVHGARLFPLPCGVPRGQDAQSRRFMQPRNKVRPLQGVCEKAGRRLYRHGALLRHFA